MFGTSCLAFPNPSRSYDPARHAVHFWAYEQSMEVSFLVTADGLRRFEPGMSDDESTCLRVFDANRDRIHAAAEKVHLSHRQDFHCLSSQDL